MKTITETFKAAGINLPKPKFPGHYSEVSDFIRRQNLLDSAEQRLAEKETAVEQNVARDERAAIEKQELSVLENALRQEVAQGAGDLIAKRVLAIDIVVPPQPKLI